MTPIRKGSNPVKIPFPIKVSDRTLAAWCNEVRVALQQLEARVPTANIGRGGGSGTALQFKIYGVRYDSGSSTWFCKVRPGWVRSRNPDADAEEPIKDWMPTAGDPAVALNAEESPEIEIANGQTVYCRVATTPKGVIEEAPTIEVADTPEAGTHFQPPGEDVEGDLYFPLCNITIEGDPAVVTLEQIQQGGPIDVVPNLPEMKNIGDKRELLKGRVAAGDTYDFRTIEQIESRGEPVIKPLGAEEEEGNTIKWKRIAEKVTQPQVKVSTKEEGEEGFEEGLIVIEGNDYDASESAVRKFTIDIKDGLVTSFLKDAVSDGWWGQVGWQFDPGGGGSLQTLTLDFEDGILVDVANSQGIAGAGTQADPGLAVLQFGDT